MPDSRDLPVAGRLIADDDGRRVFCHVCGRGYQKLGMHVILSHHMTADEYREQFGLNRETRLSSPDLVRRLAAINRPHLSRIRPDPNPVTTNPAFQLASTRPARRLEGRLKLGAIRKAHQREHPQLKKPKPDARPTTPELSQGPQRLAEMHRDPAWRREWLLKVRPRSVLTDEQITEARALVGQVTQAELAARWGVSVSTISQAQRGKLKTLEELVADIHSTEPRS